MHAGSSSSVPYSKLIILRAITFNGSDLLSFYILLFIDDFHSNC